MLSKNNLTSQNNYDMKLMTHYRQLKNETETTKYRDFYPAGSVLVHGEKVYL